MTLAIQKTWAPGTRRPTLPVREGSEQSLNISVVFTSVNATLAALQEAAALACSLGARITLVVPQVVPYPLPLESPPVLVEFNEKLFRAIAVESPVETSVQIFLCRDRLETLTSVLKPGAIVIVGGRKHWWPTKEKTLSRRLGRAGYEVIFKETE